ncbi:hypothetical protein M8J75_014614 [Diaphorina citri]|nr:hypothetical protein M8J75_014614 [Diaphorina citri]
MSPPLSCLLFLLWHSGASAIRTFSPWEMKDVVARLIEKNRDKLDFDSIIQKELGLTRKKEFKMRSDGEVESEWIEETTQKLTTFYGPYYMYKGKVYKRKSYTKEPTPSQNFTRKSWTARNTSWTTRKYSYSYKPRSTTSYKNKTTFYGPYYMFKGNLFSRKHYTKEPTIPTVKPNITSWPWKKGSWSGKGSWSKGSWAGKWTTIPWYNRTTVPWYNRTTSYGPFFMFKGKVQSRARWTSEPTENLPPWMRTKLTFRWTGFYPFTTSAWSRVPVPNYCKRRAVAVRCREDSAWEQYHDSNPSLISDLEISNETDSDIEANNYIKEHFNFDDFLDSEMYITIRPTIRQTYKHGFLWGKYPTVDWQNSFQNLDFLKDIQRQHHQAWTLEMLRFSFDPNYKTTHIVRPPWIPHSEVERYYM